MKSSSSYVFGAALAATALTAMPLKSAKAAVVGGFTFESVQNTTLFPTYTSPYTGTNTASLTATFTSTSSVTGASVGPLVADSGVGSAYGVHASASTVYSEPAGNGSNRSLNASAWAVNDYYQFSVATTGFTNLLVTFDQTSSGTGPKSFVLQYSTDGTNYVSFSSYTFATVGFSGSSTSVAGASKSFDLSGITALNGDALAAFRLVDNDSTVTNSAGTDRVDNFFVSGTAVAVPEPASLAALGVAGALLARRRSR